MIINDINEYLRKFRTPNRGLNDFVSRPPLLCSDGFSMSVQAGYGKYSDPEFDANAYAEVEVGFPSQKEPLLMPFIEDPDCPTDTVYGHVPVPVVNAVIAAHGGIVGPKDLAAWMDRRGQYFSF